jgi:prepilin-type N-terminal cleavage/methylation domain-containing protein
MNTYYKNKTARTGQAGFTLVELSIVLVIIGFLIAGIAAATNMVKQAELRSVMSDFRTYATAYNNFIGKYNAVPGDWNAAASVFGTTDCTEDTCNGNNDGLIGFNATPGTANEVKKAMRVLGLAGFINGNFDAATTDSTSTIGVNAPPSKVSGAGYVMASGDVGLITDLNFNVSQNYLLMGKQGGDNATLSAGAITPSDAHNLDSKMDDGNIDTNGAFIGATSGSLMAADAAGTTIGDCAAAATGIYAVGTTSNACVLGFSLN